jgi:hypothetical protein
MTLLGVGDGIQEDGDHLPERRRLVEQGPRLRDGYVCPVLGQTLLVIALVLR